MTDESQRFTEWLYSLSIIEYNRTLTELLIKCHVGKRSLTYWRKGKRRPNWHCRRIINEIAGKQIYNLNN